MTRLALHWEILIGMVAGAIIGVTCNLLCGEHTAQVPHDQLPAGIQQISFVDTTNHVEIRVTANDGTERRLLVDPTQLGAKNVFATVDQLAEKQPQLAKLFERYGSSWARWIGVALSASGICFSACCRWWPYH